jgi:hypothetical protein
MGGDVVNAFDDCGERSFGDVFIVLRDELVQSR